MEVHADNESDDSNHETLIRRMMEGNRILFQSNITHRLFIQALTRLCIKTVTVWKWCIRQEEDTLYLVHHHRQADKCRRLFAVAIPSHLHMIAPIALYAD